MATGGDLASLAAVVAAVTACMGYARFAARRLRPGLPRLAALLPVLAILPLPPLAFRAIHPRVISAFFLAWVAEFRLLLLAFDQGQLHPSLSLPAFVAFAALPITLRDPKSAARRQGLGLVEAAAMATLVAAIVSLYRHAERMNGYVLLSLYSLHFYLALELILAATAAAARAFLGLDLEPQFDRPYLSASLREFWGRRWNLSVSALLRQSVFRPVRARHGTVAAGVVVFAVSGLMHEVLYSYVTLRAPTGNAVALFALHGAWAGAEGWWAAHERWPRPPRALATLLTLAFVAVTVFWLFFPPLMRAGADKQMIAECEAMVAFLRDAVGSLLPGRL
nr:unnamed protein product [Digitaria exilis]